MGFELSVRFTLARKCSGESVFAAFDLLRELFVFSVCEIPDSLFVEMITIRADGFQNIAVVLFSITIENLERNKKELESGTI